MYKINYSNIGGYFVLITICLYYVSSIVKPIFYLMFLLSFVIVGLCYIKKGFKSFDLVVYSLILVMVIQFILVYMRYGELTVSHSTFTFFISLLYAYFISRSNISGRFILYGLAFGGMLNGVMMILDVLIAHGVTRAGGGKEEVNAAALLQVLSLYSVLVIYRDMKIRIFALCVPFLLVTVLLTASRSGLLSLIVTGMYFLRNDISVKNISSIFVVAILSIWSVYNFDSLSFLRPTLDFLYSRVFEPNDGDSSSTNSRFVEMYAAFQVIYSEPKILLFGLGPGFTDNIYWAGNDGFWRVHSTYVALLIEHGLIGSILLLVLIVFDDRWQLKISDKLLMVPILISSLAIYSLYLLPIPIILLNLSKLTIQEKK